MEETINNIVGVVTVGLFAKRRGGCGFDGDASGCDYNQRLTKMPDWI